MKLYLIVYGSDSLMATFEADDRAHAVEQFVSWAPVSHNDQGNLDSITHVYICEEVGP